MTDPPLVMLLCADLMWTSRFLAICQSLGCRLLAARDLPRLQEHLAKETPSCVVFEIGMAPATEVIAAVTAAHPRAKIIGYGAHVDAAGLHAATAAGCTAVHTFGQLAAGLPDLLPTWLGKS